MPITPPDGAVERDWLNRNRPRPQDGEQLEITDDDPGLDEKEITPPANNERGGYEINPITGGFGEVISMKDKRSK